MILSCWRAGKYPLQNEYWRRTENGAGLNVGYKRAKTDHTFHPSGVNRIRLFSGAPEIYIHCVGGGGVDIHDSHGLLDWRHD